MMVMSENCGTCSETCPSATLSSTNHALTLLTLNLCLCSDRPAKPWKGPLHS